MCVVQNIFTYRCFSQIKKMCTYSSFLIPVASLSTVSGFPTKDSLTAPLTSASSNASGTTFSSSDLLDSKTMVNMLQPTGTLLYQDYVSTEFGLVI